MSPHRSPGRLISRFAVLAVLVAGAAGGCGQAGEPRAREVVVAPGSQVAAPPPPVIWPSSEQAELERLHALANDGRRPDLLDPVGAAKAYLAAALPGEVNASAAAVSGLAYGRFAAAGPDAGEVAVRGPRMSPTTVSMHRFVGPAARASGRPIWCVQGVASEALAVIDPDYDGTRLTGSLVPTAAGRLTVRTSTLDGRLLAQRTLNAAPGHLVDLGTSAPGQSGLVVRAALAADDGTTALRAFILGPPGPG
jgi:hypothetical protein